MKGWHVGRVACRHADVGRDDGGVTHGPGRWPDRAILSLRVARR
jgi:hypothetical protein